MKSSKKSSKNNPNGNPKTAPKVRERDLKVVLKDLCELTSRSPWVKDYYVISRVWAWGSKIRTKPRLSIPVPRFFTVRDP